MKEKTKKRKDFTCLLLFFYINDKDIWFLKLLIKSTKIMFKTLTLSYQELFIIFYFVIL